MAAPSGGLEAALSRAAAAYGACARASEASSARATQDGALRKERVKALAQKLGLVDHLLGGLRKDAAKAARAAAEQRKNAKAAQAQYERAAVAEAGERAQARVAAGRQIQTKTQFTHADTPTVDTGSASAGTPSPTSSRGGHEPLTPSPGASSLSSGGSPASSGSSTSTTGSGTLASLCSGGGVTPKAPRSHINGAHTPLSALGGHGIGHGPLTPGQHGRGTPAPADGGSPYRGGGQPSGRWSPPPPAPASPALTQEQAEVAAQIADMEGQREDCVNALNATKRALYFPLDAQSGGGGGGWRYHAGGEDIFVGCHDIFVDRVAGSFAAAVIAGAPPPADGDGGVASSERRRMRLAQHPRVLFEVGAPPRPGESKERAAKRGLEASLRVVRFGLVGEKGSGVPDLTVKSMTVRVQLRMSADFEYAEHRQEWQPVSSGGVPGGVKLKIVKLDTSTKVANLRN